MLIQSAECIRYAFILLVEKEDFHHLLTEWYFDKQTVLTFVKANALKIQWHWAWGLVQQRNLDFISNFRSYYRSQNPKMFICFRYGCLDCKRGVCIAVKPWFDIFSADSVEVLCEIRGRWPGQQNENHKYKSSIFKKFSRRLSVLWRTRVYKFVYYIPGGM